MKKLIAGALLSAAVMMAGEASAQDLKFALIYSKTGPLEAYAKQTENGLTLGLKFLTQGSLSLNGRKIIVLPKDDQGKPDIAKSLLEQAYADDKVDLAIGATSSGATLAMLPIAEDAKKILIVEPAVADSITGEKWNRYIFRTSRNSTQDALATAVAFGSGEVSVATLAQDYAFGRDGVAALKEALAATHSKAKIVFEEYAPQNATDFTASAQRLFDALKDKPGRKIITFIWAGPHPLAKIADLKPERYGIELAPGGNILPVMKQFRQHPGIEGAIYYYYRLSQEPDERLAGHRASEALQHAAGFLHRRRHGGRERRAYCDQEGRRRRKREADRRDGGHGVRYAQGQDDAPQGGSPGHAGHVRLQDQGRGQERVRSAGSGA